MFIVERFWVGWIGLTKERSEQGQSLKHLKITVKRVEINSERALPGVW